MREMRVFAHRRWLSPVVALIAAVLGEALFWVTPVAAQGAPATGDAVIQAMHDRYARTWYRTLTFTQKTTRRTPADTMAIETWTECGLFPGHLRINTQRPTGNSVVIYSGDSLFIVRGDSTANRLASRNILMIIGF